MKKIIFPNDVEELLASLPLLLDNKEKFREVAKQIQDKFNNFKCPCCGKLWNEGRISKDQ